MKWIHILEILGMIITAGLIAAPAGALRKNIKDSKTAKQSERCDLA